MDIDPHAVVFDNTVTVYPRWDILNAVGGGPDTPLDEKQKHYTNWREFARVVCEPIVMAKDEAPEEVLALLRGECLYYLVMALYMADCSLTRCENGIARTPGGET